MKQINKKHHLQGRPQSPVFRNKLLQHNEVSYTTPEDQLLLEVNPGDKNGRQKKHQVQIKNTLIKLAPQRHIR